MDKRDEKVEIRLRISKWHREILEEYCKIYGSTQSAALCGCITSVLCKSLARMDILSKNINIIYSDDSTKSGKSNSKPRKKKGTTISDNFDPPKSITQEEGLNHELAVELFVDWAKGKGHVQADWNATFRNACRGWIKERLPQERDEWEGVKRV